MNNGVLLDTSFFLRFLNDEDPLCENANSYFKFFIQKGLDMVISTISIAEYCVGGSIAELPLRNLQILPFNFDHSKRTGEFARIVFQHKKKLRLRERAVIPNDSKLFAQADAENGIRYYLSSDTESVKIYQLIKSKVKTKFQFIDLKIPCHETFGLLNL